VPAFKVFDLKGEVVGEIELPRVFSTPVRPDIIRRAVIALMTSRLQPKGTDELAGMRTTAESWGVGHGVARVPRVKGGSRAARAPMTVGGRRAHPPRVDKKIREFINVKERRIAVASALAATANPLLVKMRGHAVEGVKQVPLIVVDELERVSRTSEVREAFRALGLWGDVERAHKGTRVRAGKGKLRGRRYKVPKSVLVVVSEDGGIFRAARNLPGVDVVKASDLNVEVLAPGGVPGRLTVYTLSSLKVIEERFGGVKVWSPLKL